LHIDTLAENVTSVPIGRPISNAQIYILDRRNKPVPVGVIGEMYIGGDGIADGYLNRPELTVERFVPDPFSTDPQARMYKTGDLARWRSDGIIEFLGRNDHQVKVRGFRVELSEIEAHLLRHPNVAEAVVLAQGDAAGEKRLVAYVSPKSISSAPDAQTLRAYLKPLLPDYMIPSAFVVLERLPLSSTGKVDRRALPAASNDAYAGMTSEAPLDDSERVLARIWQELLGVNQIGRSDNFFQMGGHSLLAIKTIFVINSTLSTKLKVADLYGAPTIAELASRVRGEVFQDRVIDIASEAALDDRITAAREPASTRDGAVLLTGATGFVGRFMLSELLRSRSAKIYCMVRANSDEEATQRIKYAMKHWDLWRYEFESRVVAMAGDLRLPELGLSSSDYRQLADDVDSMYHCATSMNHLQTYAAAKAANVGGAKALVELATIGRTKIINYASTLGVFNAAVSTNGRSVDEATTIDDEEHHDSNGYVASKWVAEKVFMNAAQRGVPCNIFRLGLVWADSHRGRYDELQRVYRIFKSCLLSGVGIRNYQRYEMPFTAVDFVSKALAHLGGKHRSGCNVFHISAPAQMTQDVFACCNDTFGMSLELLPLYDWIREISRIHQAERALPATPLVEFALSMSENSFYDLHRTHARMRISCEKTQAELDRVGIRPPRLGVESLAMVLEDMMSRDSELVEIKERRGAGTVGSWAYDGSQPSGGPAA
jgi:thioester reductase-like protein